MPDHGENPLRIAPFGATSARDRQPGTGRAPRGRREFSGGDRPARTDRPVSAPAVPTSSMTIPLDDPRWDSLLGLHGRPYDVRPALRRLETRWTDRRAWDELWENLHHQGDVGEVSYGAVGNLVALAERASPSTRDWNFYGLAATIETERHRRASPVLPSWLAPLYGQAWIALLRMALLDLRCATDIAVVQTALAVVALGRGVLPLGALLAGLSPSEIVDRLDQELAWKRLYDESRTPSQRSMMPRTREELRREIDDIHLANHGLTGHGVVGVEAMMALKAYAKRLTELERPVFREVLLEAVTAKDSVWHDALRVLVAEEAVEFGPRLVEVAESGWGDDRYRDAIVSA